MRDRHLRNFLHAVAFIPDQVDAGGQCLRVECDYAGVQRTGHQHAAAQDITYIAVGNGYCYLSLVTDAYSRKIVGWCLWQNLKRDGTVAALKMALDSTKGVRALGLIHHSDRGLQYCSREYTDLLSMSGVTISMTEKGDPYENAIAERVNGILKGELGLGRRFGCYEQALVAVPLAIDTYNHRRPHASCNYLTPEQAHQLEGRLKSKWKKHEHKPLVEEAALR